MHIEIHRESKTPLYLQIKKQITGMIISGALPPNYILPSERKLAHDLDINRSTVVKAYMDLKSEGLIESYRGKGSIVLSQLSTDPPTSRAYVPTIRWNQLESRLIAQTNESYISKILSILEREDVISFASGIPAESSYPVKLFGGLQTQLTETYQEKLLMPTGVDGSSELKSAITDILRKKGIKTSPKQIMITSGSQQAIDFFGKLLIEPGDVVIVEEPTYLGAIEAFESYGARLVGIPMEEDGIQLDILETCLAKYRPKFIYTQPTFQNPSSITMSLEKRKKLLQLAYYYQVPILEDDPYSELRFEGEPLPSLKALDAHDYVVYLSSFSKTLSFGLRVGFTVSSEHILQRFIQFKQSTDIQTNTLAQFLIAAFIKQGHYMPHVRSITDQYKAKRDLMIRELSKSTFQTEPLLVPEGGYFLWYRLPDAVRLSIFMEQLAAENVIVMPGELFYPHKNADKTYIRLNYSYPTEQEIIDGVGRLLKTIENSLIPSCSTRSSLMATVNPFL